MSAMSKTLLRLRHTQSIGEYCIQLWVGVSHDVYLESLFHFRGKAASLTKKQQHTSVLFPSCSIYGCMFTIIVSAETAEYLNALCI